MTHKLIKTEQYLLVVDFEKTFSKGFRLWVDGETGKPYINSNTSTVYGNPILAHLPLNNAPVLEGVDLLPAIQKIENGYGEAEWNNHWTNVLKKESCATNGKREVFLAGYKAATKTYSEEDLRKAVEEGYMHCTDSSVDYEERFKNLVQSLQQPAIPVGFKADFFCTGTTMQQDMNCPCFEMEGKTCKVKTIPNQQGIPVWQGEYIYKTE